jgi:hypothetical protein
MPNDWRKRPLAKPVRGLRSYAETWCSNDIRGSGRCRPDDPGGRVHARERCATLAPASNCQNDFCPLCHARLLSEHERNAVGNLLGDNLLIEAFLETAAPRGANGVLDFEITMAVGLFVGARLARRVRAGSALVFGWVGLSLGMATYTRWYVPHLFRK